MRFKLMLGLLLILSGHLCFGQDFYLYGQTVLYGIGFGENPDYIPEVETSDFDVAIFQNISAVFQIGDMASVETDLQLSGTLMNTIESFGVSTAPIDLSVNQLFVQVPLYDWLIFYGGKRIKEIGTAEIYPILNRINPRFFTHTYSDSQGAGLLEINAFPLHWLNLSGVLYFKDLDFSTTRWEDLSILVHSDFSFYPVDFSIIFYSEKFQNFPVGLSFSGQIEDITLYGEYLYSHKSTRKVVVDMESDDPEQAFDFRSDESFHSLNVGGKFTSEFVGVTLEYAYNSDAYTKNDAEDFRQYISEFGAGIPESVMTSEEIENQKAGLVSVLRTKKNFYPHNLGVSFVYWPSFAEGLQLDLNAQVSFQGVQEEYAAYWGYELSGRISYSLQQSLQIFTEAKIGGGAEESEFRLYNDNLFTVFAGFNLQY